MSGPGSVMMGLGGCDRIDGLGNGMDSGGGTVQAVSPDRTPGGSPAQVRRLAAADWPVLRDLRTAALRDAPRAFLGDPVRERAQSAQAWQAWCETGIWLLAERDGQPVGLVHGTWDPDNGDCFVESMWVSPDHRRRGVGRSLLARAGDWAREHGRTAMFLWVLDGNHATRAFYVKLGFVPTGRRQPIGPGLVRIEEEFRLDLAAATVATAVGLSGPDRAAGAVRLADR